MSEIRQTPAPRGGFASGFFGCFGVLAAIVVVFVALAIFGNVSGGMKESAVTNGTAAPRDYVASCAMGLGAAQDVTGRLGSAHLSVVDPVILEQRPKGARVQCVLDVPQGLGAVTVDVSCGAMERRCIDLVSAVSNGHILYLSKAAMHQPPRSTTR